MFPAFCLFIMFSFTGPIKILEKLYIFCSNCDAATKSDRTAK